MPQPSKGPSEGSITNADRSTSCSQARSSTVDGIDLITDFVKTGRLLGLGVGYPLSEIEDMIRSDYIDEGDGTTWMRRDYGLAEFNLSGPRWEITNASMEVHRLASDPELLRESNTTIPARFERYSAWQPLKRAMLRSYQPIQSTPQGEFIQYLSPTRTFQ